MSGQVDADAGTPPFGSGGELLPTSITIEADWALIASNFGKQLRGDVRQAIAKCPPGYCGGDYDRAARTFFTWLGSADGNQGLSLVRNLYADAEDETGSRSADELTVQTAVNPCFERFCDELPAYASISGSTIWRRQRCAALVLEKLGGVSARNYPAFLVALHRRHRDFTATPMLGSLAVASGIGEPPGIRRERAALDRVGLLALEEFRDHVAMIEAGKKIRDDYQSFPGMFCERECVGGVLTQAWAEMPNRRASTWRTASDLIGAAPDLAELPATWVAAGIPERCVRRFTSDGERMSRSVVGQLALACLGPSPTMLISGMAVIACGRGWNKGSMLELASDPFVFAVRGQYGLASGSFMAAVKNRARHAVTMFLSDPQDTAAAPLEELIGEWRDVTTGPGGDLVGDQMLLGIDPDDAWAAAVLEVVHGLIRVSEPLRLHDKVYGSIDRLFAYPPLRLRHARNFEHRLALKASTTPALATGEVTFPAIRASWVYLDYSRRRSLSATTAAAGQVTPSVTLKNYLNRREVAEEMNRAVRFFQSICQTLARADGVTALRIALPETDILRLRRLAVASGMAAAFGLGAPQDDRMAPTLQFTPSDANLRDLFLTLWATRVANRMLPCPVWLARCFELYVVARAIAAEVCSAGLASKYADAARAAHADVRAGRVSLPQVEGA